MEKLAIVTMVTDPAWQPLADLTLPTHRAYAARLGADLVVLDRKVYPHPHYDKWQLRELFDRFDRLLYLDADTIVRPETPDLFVMVPPERFAGENELLSHPPHADGLRDFVARMGLPALAHVPFYINGGVFLASRCHREVFREPERVLADLPWPEQHHLNARLIAEKVPMYLLPPSFNDRHRRAGYLRESFVLHYSVTGMAERMTRVRDDLCAWEVLFRHEQRTPELA